MFVGPLQFEIVEGVFVGFETDVFEELRDTDSINRLPVVPPLRIDRFLNTGPCHSIKMLPHFDKNVSSALLRFTIDVYDRMCSRSRTGKAIENAPTFLAAYHHHLLE